MLTIRRQQLKALEKAAAELSGRPASVAVQPCPLQQSLQDKLLHWIEIQLIGEDGKPIPAVEYRIVLPSGEEATGFLDKAGLARVDGIETPGMCKVSFPELDKDAWEPVNTATASES